MRRYPNGEKRVEYLLGMEDFAVHGAAPSTARRITKRESPRVEQRRGDLTPVQ
jgi:hypothetical protein